MHLHLDDMWDIEEIPDFEHLPPADQLWIIALGVEENGGPTDYVAALRALAERLEELGWWVGGEAGTHEHADPRSALPTCLDASTILRHP